MTNPIQGDQLSIVVQGVVSAAAARALATYRERVPRAQIILSTYENYAQAADGLRDSGLVDVLVINADPGALPPTVKSATAGPNNLNRMLTSTKAGLQHADREYVLKVRSDAQVDPVLVMQRWAAEGERDRLLFASRYTRHPFGINGYLFHLSDWITFGSLQNVRAYWAAPLMSESDASYFERAAMPDKATATARRFRARMTQEQWICTHYAQQLGYRVPTRLAERNSELVQQYIDFLARECIVCDRENLGLVLDKHERSFTSFFQRIDCLGESEWRAIQLSSRMDKSRNAGWRTATFAMRGFISRMVLLRKRLLS